MALPDDTGHHKTGHHQAAPADVTATRTGHARLAGQGGTATGHGSVDGWRACKTSYTDRYGSPAKTGSRRCKGAGGPQPGLPGLLPDPENPLAYGEWTIRWTFRLLPVGLWAQFANSLAMQLTCGACGHEGGATRFVGSAWLELNVDELAEGWIEDDRTCISRRKQSHRRAVFLRSAAPAASAQG